MGRKILFITTDQQRYDALGCNGGTVARTPVVDRWAAEGRALHARPRAGGGLHAGALDDDHRTVRAHARRVDERRAAARGLAQRRGVPEGEGRLSHGADRQGAFRALPRSQGALLREPHGTAGRARPASRLRPHGAGRTRRTRAAALPAMAGEEPPPDVEGFYNVAEAAQPGAGLGGRRRYRGDPGQAQPCRS